MSEIKKKNYNVGVYCRVSTQEQAESGFGIDVQMSKINAYLSLFDYELENITYYIDEGISAKDMKRKRLQALLKEVENGNIDLVIIYKLDRLSRSVIDVYKIIELLNNNNCNLIAVMDQLDISSANGRMMVGMLAIISQWERETISERTNDGMIQMAKQGLFPRGGKPPFGYIRGENNKLEINEEEAILIRTAFKMACDGCNMSEIQRYLSDKGKKYVKSDAIKILIQNKVYYGDFYFKGVKYTNITPPIISKKMYLDANKSISRLLCHKDNEKYYFSYLLKCQSGHSLLSKSTKKPTRRYYYYVCEECQNQRINQQVIIEEVLFRLITNSFHKDYTKFEKRCFTRIKSINNSIEEAYTDYINSRLDAKTYAFTLSKLETDKKNEMDKIKNIKVSNYIDWISMSDRERKYFVQNNVKEIVVDITLKKVLKIEFK
ncbi:site-specific DNA recombinase [Breznakia sp. PF5-3]|uniref:recombinase family protein n=1 Tax=unclassified Breznakia TaxID=2623764 RepID=UPI0024065C1C|nr:MULTISPECIES: recombinase family protein [unclassified Breznakia]MDF9825750.1 site-specific DNA recombinase [Breznakia sp. PM6-1]MDF9836559.1 site-specific DNA recombinase [Breznakia sp. PF5-3]MDF9838777.1 site-specific DNA recombinase [Breznakia sp. PFB2-8]MDF9860809.1 site-specific DNA recombinase [Breznakia sp. PH5-24]